MSSSLFLYKYPEGPQGRYIEETAQKIEECFISDAILGDIEDLKPWAELTVFEEKLGESQNIVTCVSNAKIGDLKLRITELFVRSMHIEHVSIETTELLDTQITDVRTICNIHFLLRLKLEKFQMDDRVVIQLG